MSSWTVLGIKPTSDEREIRRAYAQKLKITRPDDDPEGYQILREAYEQALVQAPFYTEKESFFDDLINDDQGQADENNSVSTNSAPIKVEKEVVEKISQFTTGEIEKDYNLSQIKPFSSDVTLNLIQENNETSYSANFILEQLKYLYLNKGEVGLLEEWENIQEFLFDQLAFDEQYELSLGVFNFAKNYDIQHPIIWQQWEEYFHWLSNYHMADYISPEDLEIIAFKLEEANQYLWGDNNYTNKSIDVKKHQFPIAQALVNYIKNGGYRIVAIFYAFLIVPSINQECNKEVRYALMKKNKTISFIYDWAFVLRCFWGFGLFYIFIFIDPYKDSSGMTMLGSVFIYALSLYGFLFICCPVILTIFSKIHLINYKISKKTCLIRGLIIPLIIVIIDVFTNMAGGALIFWTVVILWFVSYFTFISMIDTKEIGMSVSLLGMVLSFSFKSVGLNDYWVLMFSLILIWINSNLFLDKYKSQSVSWYFKEMDKYFRNIPDNKKTYLSILRLLKLIVFWFFFIPLSTGLFLEKSRDYKTLIEMGLLIFIGINYLEQYSGYSILLFYPLALVIYSGYQILKDIVFLKLKVKY